MRKSRSTGRLLVGLLQAIKEPESGVGSKLVLQEGAGLQGNTITLQAPATLAADRTITVADADLDLTPMVAATKQTSWETNKVVGAATGITVQAPAGNVTLDAVGAGTTAVAVGNSGAGVADLTVDGTIQGTEGILHLGAAGVGMILTGADATAAATIVLPEDTDNGAHTVTITPPQAITADVVFTLPNANMTIGEYLSDIHVTDAGALTVKSGVTVITTGGAETRTLAIPTSIGQDLTLMAGATMTGAATITVASDIDENGNDTITLTNIGDMVRLIAVNDTGTLRWQYAGGSLAAGAYSLLS